MADDADLNWTSEIAHFPALGQRLRGRRRDGSGCRWHIEFLFKLQSQPLNLGAMLSTKSSDARFRNDHAVLREQILNLRESCIFGSQHEDSCAMSLQMLSSLRRDDKVACSSFQRGHA
jgi:hypothetical protein